MSFGMFCRRPGVIGHRIPRTHCANCLKKAAQQERKRREYRLVRRAQLLDSLHVEHETDQMRSLKMPKLRNGCATRLCKFCTCERDDLHLGRGSPRSRQLRSEERSV